MEKVFDMFKIGSYGQDVRISNNLTIKYPNLLDLGSHIAIDDYCYISTRLLIKDYVHIANHVSIIGGKESNLIMGNHTNISCGSRIVCGGDDFKEHLISPVVPEKYRKVTLSTITFEDYSTIGVNCVIMPGVTLAEGSVVGANSFVNKNTEPWGIYIGSPAKLVGYRNKENILRLSKELNT